MSVAVAVEAINSLLRKVRSPLPTFLDSSGTTGPHRCIGLTSRSCPQNLMTMLKTQKGDVSFRFIHKDEVKA